jgi:hypothetical protein
MSNKTKTTSEMGNLVHSENLTEFPYKSGIGLIQSTLIVLTCLGMLEVGFIYTTIIAYILMTIAFHEMITLQARQDKEVHI